MKKALVTVLSLLLLLIPFEVSAAGAVGSFPLSDEELAALETRTETLESSYNISVTLLCVESLDGSSAKDFAEGYYEANGLDGECGGVLYLLCVNEREFYTYAHGSAADAIGTDGVAALSEAVSDSMSAGDYASAYTAYLDTLDAYLKDFFSAPKETCSTDTYTEHEADGGSVWVGVAISAGVGLIVGLIVILVMRSGMNTVTSVNEAGSYAIRGSFALRSKRDIFLYNTLTRTRRQESNDNRSSSNTSVGGGGKF